MLPFWMMSQLRLKLWSNLNPNKAAGPDNWSPKVLKEMAEQLCIPLTILFRKSSSTSTLPTSWKRGHIIPIHKKGSHRLVDPITLTLIVGKLLESIVKDHILDNFISNNLFSSYQHGFMPGKSCVTQLLYVMALDWISRSGKPHWCNLLWLL